MSQRAETRIFDIVVVVLFVFVLGFLAFRARAPETSSIPGANWPSQPESKLILDSKTILEGDPLPPSVEALPVPGETVSPVMDGTVPDSDHPQGDWQ
ncbi:MAG: hypothetical protein ABIR96_02545 [Bdellovibrionota bacterium]